MMRWRSERISSRNTAYIIIGHELWVWVQLQTRGSSGGPKREYGSYLAIAAHHSVSWLSILLPQFLELRWSMTNVMTTLGNHRRR